MKKVLFVLHSLEFGGAERSLVNLFNELKPDQFEIDLLLFQRKGKFLSQVPGWVNVLETPTALRNLYAPVKHSGMHCATKIVGTLCGRLMRRTRKSSAAWRWRHFYNRRIKKLSRHYDVAIAYVGSEVMYYIADKVDADRRLVWIHNDYRTGGYSKADDKPYFDRMDEIVSVSEECVNVLAEEFPEHRERMHYIQNITSSKVVRKQALDYLPEEFDANGHNILSIGRLMEQKGFDMAVDAAAMLKKRGIDFKWFIIGTGVLEESLKKQIHSYGLDEQFILLGTRSNPYPYIRNCTLFVQPSRYEGKSVALDEAKILCAPIVVTDYPSAKDQIENGVEGLIVDMVPEAIAEGIAELLPDRAKIERLRDLLASREYGNQDEVSKYIELIDKE